MRPHNCDVKCFWAGKLSGNHISQNNNNSNNKNWIALHKYLINCILRSLSTLFWVCRFEWIYVSGLISSSHTRRVPDVILVIWNKRNEAFRCWSSRMVNWLIRKANAAHSFDNCWSFYTTENSHRNWTTYNHSIYCFTRLSLELFIFALFFSRLAILWNIDSILITCSTVVVLRNWANHLCQHHVGKDIKITFSHDIEWIWSLYHCVNEHQSDTQSKHL